MSKLDDSHYPHATWRLIQTPPVAGAWNMAVDEAILETIAQKGKLPVLRLYAWEPVCLSLGQAQPVADADRQRLADFGWDLVRRPTGGRAILHTDELTYSVIGPTEEPRLSGSILESYRRLAEALLGALHRLDIPAEANPEVTGDNSQLSKMPVCFEMPSSYEITAHGKKLVGSAQARRKDGVLQHGSLPLYGELERITQALVFPDEPSRQQAADRLARRATTIKRVLGYPISWDEAAKAFVEAFQDKLNLELQASELTAGETKRAAQLVETKYAHPSWTERI